MQIDGFAQQGRPMKAYIISHTHWDREWYQTFQDYRARGGR